MTTTIANFDQLPRRESAVDACERAIREAILGGEIAAGERLPPERALADRFGVNRVTVRSALARCQAARLVDVRQGSGYIARDFVRVGGPDLLTTLLELAVEPSRFARMVEDLLLVRRQLAEAVLRCLVARPDRTRARLEPIRAAVESFARVADDERDTGALAAADLAILDAMVAATGSPVLQLCLNPVAEILGGIEALRDHLYAEPSANARAWRALMAWLEAGDVAGLGDVLGVVEARDRATVAELWAAASSGETNKRGER